jgi:hypothetical protein
MTKTKARRPRSASAARSTSPMPRPERFEYAPHCLWKTPTSCSRQSAACGSPLRLASATQVSIDRRLAPLPSTRQQSVRHSPNRRRGEAALSLLGKYAVGRLAGVRFGTVSSRQLRKAAHPGCANKRRQPDTSIASRRDVVSIRVKN